MTHYIYNKVRSMALVGLLLTTCSVASAQINLGYCGDEVASTGLSNAKLNATISCAMGLPPAVLSDYAFGQVDKIQVGLSATEGLTSFQVWVRRHLTDEQPLAQAEVPTDQLQVGWNQIDLPSPIGLEGQDTLYFGYSYSQREKVKCISYNGKKGTPDSFFISGGSKWNDYSTKHAPVSIRAGLSSLADHGIRLSDLRLDLRSQSLDQAQYRPITLTGHVMNIGNQPLTDYTLQVADNGQMVTDSLILCSDHPLAFGQEGSFTCTFVPGHDVQQAAYDIPVAVSLGHPNGDTEGILANCERTLYYELGNSSSLSDCTDFLIEEFTSEECGYAPVGQQRLREAIEEAHRINLGDRYQAWLDGEAVGYNTHYEILSRHEGYGPADAWRVSTNSDYTPELFGPDRLSFAPAMTINRSFLPVSTTLPVDTLAQRIADYQQPNVVTFSIAPDGYRYDAESHKVSIDLTLTLWTATFCEEPCIALCLKQEEVPSVNQKNYYPESCDSSRQPDPVRCFLTSTTGSNALFMGVDMEAVAAGQLPITDFCPKDEQGRLTRSMTFEGTLPADLSSPEGLTLVGYVYDRKLGGGIYGMLRKEL